MRKKIYALFPSCPTILVKCSQGRGKAGEYLENLTGQLPKEPNKEQTGSKRHPRPRPQAEGDTEGPPPALLLFTFPPEPRVLSGFNLSLGHTRETDLGRGRPGRTEAIQEHRQGGGTVRLGLRPSGGQACAHGWHFLPTLGHPPQVQGSPATASLESSGSPPKQKVLGDSLRITLKAASLSQEGAQESDRKGLFPTYPPISY